MSDPLYRKELLRLAADAAGAGRLTVPCGSATVHNPVCGDKVTVDVAVEEGRIVAIAHHTTACVLAQASAAILGGEGMGLSQTEIGDLHSAVSAMLNGADPPGAPFNVYAAFNGVCEHKNRHRCVLLPIEAAIAAFANSQSVEAAGKRTQS